MGIITEYADENNAPDEMLYILNHPITRINPSYKAYYCLLKFAKIVYISNSASIPSGSLASLGVAATI